MHRLAAPHINWRQGAPICADYGDIFYHPDEGAAESAHVFLEGCGLPARFGDAHHTVFELGFGSGLNLFNTWQCWEQHTKTSAHNTTHNAWLTYIAIEHRPWEPSDIRRAMQAFPALSPIAARFLSQYPMPYGGRWLLRFADIRLRVILLWQDATDPWPIADNAVDSWFLDGFAPHKNPEMWQADIAKRIRAHSKPNAVLATFSSARRVRDALTAAGFQPEKRAGILGKREVLRAVLCKDGQPTKYNLCAIPPRTVAVVGAGIAGLELAHHLAEYGACVHVFEKSEKVASAASANPAVIHRPKVTADHSARSKQSLAGFHYQKMRIVAALAAEPEAPPFARYPGVWWQPDNPELTAKHHQAFGAPLYEVHFSRDGLYMPSAGWFDMGAYCRYLAKQIQTLHLNTRITGVVADPTNPTKMCVQASQQSAASSAKRAKNAALDTALNTAFDVVVFTTGASGFSHHAALHKAFGAMHRAPYDHANLPHDARIFSGHGGMISDDGNLYVGASFIRNAVAEPTPAVSLAENQARAAYFIAKNGMMEPTTAFTPFWSGVRAMARHQTAYVARLDSDNHGFDWAIDTHSEAASGRGVYAFTGLGAQGSTLAAMTAERIAAAIMGISPDTEITHRIISA